MACLKRMREAFPNSQQPGCTNALWPEGCHGGGECFLWIICRSYDDGIEGHVARSVDQLQGVVHGRKNRDDFHQ